MILMEQNCGKSKGEYCTNRTKSALKSLAWGHPVKVFESFDEMRLVVIAVVKKELVLLQTLYRWFGVQNLLKTYHLTKGFGRIADVKFKQSPQLPRTQANVEVFFNAQCAGSG